MVRAKGFTLIELLLVLAIIGIISAIAIPALLGQRSRARDKSCQTNATAIVGDIISAADRHIETTGSLSTVADLNSQVLGTTVATSKVPVIWSAKNPWNTAGALPAYAQAAIQEASSDGATTRGVATAAKKGQVQIGWLPPTGAIPATLVTGVYLQNTFKDGAGADTNVFLKISNLD